MKKLSTVLLIGAATLFIGCGSGGSSSSSSSDTVPTDVSQAAPTIDNAQETAEAVVANNPTTSTTTLNSLGLNSVTGNKPNALQATLNLASTIDMNKIPLNEAISETDQCPDGGTMSVSGSGDDSGGDVTITYDNCQMDSLTINGKIEATASGCDNDCGCAEVNIKYLDDLTMQYSSEPAVTVNAGSQTDLKYTYDDTCIPVNVNALETSFYEVDNQKYGVENLNTIINTDLDNLETSWYYTKGNIYINNLQNYVTVDPNYDMSQTPFVYSYMYGLRTGKAVFDMSNGGKTIVQINNGEIEVGLDSNGDGIVDENTTITTP